LWSCR